MNFIVSDSLVSFNAYVSSVTEYKRNEITEKEDRVVNFLNRGIPLEEIAYPSRKTVSIKAANHNFFRDGLHCVSIDALLAKRTLL